MYWDVLNHELLHFLQKSVGEKFLFQQDGASVHRSNFTKEWMDSNDIYVFPWSEKSTYLNPIEKLWGILSSIVYKNQRQFENIEELKDCITEEWDYITSTVCNNLISSIPRRCLQKIERSGNKNDYWCWLSYFWLKMIWSYDKFVRKNGPNQLFYILYVYYLLCSKFWYNYISCNIYHTYPTFCFVWDVLQS